MCDLCVAVVHCGHEKGNHGANARNHTTQIVGPACKLVPPPPKKKPRTSSKEHPGRPRNPENSPSCIRHHTGSRTGSSLPLELWLRFWIPPWSFPLLFCGSAKLECAPLENAAEDSLHSSFRPQRIPQKTLQSAASLCATRRIPPRISRVPRANNLRKNLDSRISPNRELCPLIFGPAFGSHRGVFLYYFVVVHWSAHHREFCRESRTSSFRPGESLRPCKALHPGVQPGESRPESQECPPPQATPGVPSSFYGFKVRMWSKYLYSVLCAFCYAM